jgi:RNA polymerase sigma-70 factor (ECF subfamily)
MLPIFTTTHWSLVQAAGGEVSTDALAALETLSRAYWYPLYAFARRSGCSTADAEDLTQGFFAKLIEKSYLAQASRERGRFRSFLLASFKHYLHDDWKSAQRQKRGGAQEHVSIDAQQAEERYRWEPADQMDAERLYQRRWAMTVLDNALRRLEAELTEAGRQPVFARLQGLLVGDRGETTYADAARDLDTTEAAVKMTVSRLRQRARDLIRDEIAQTVCTAAEVDEEFRALLDALRS